MKNLKRTISGAVFIAGVFALSAPALADWRAQRREYREDLRDLRNARWELRRDLRRGAGPEEIARDRAAIARERRELREHRSQWDNGRSWPRYGRYGDDHDRRPWHRWDRWDRSDRGRHRGWWR